MRTRRIVVRGGDSAVYHCISRTVDGEMLFGSLEKERFRRMLWRVADFSGVEILTYCVMGNHFHVLVRVSPVPKEGLSDAEVVRRFRILYPKRTRYQLMDAGRFEQELASGTERARAMKVSLEARMGDVSEFMKTLKSRFTIWFNQTHRRFGALWSERFKSVLVENSPWALRTVAAYIDLNPVRAGLVKDPKDYRYSGYGEAVGGGASARKGIFSAVGGGKNTLSAYRIILFGKGAVAGPGECGIPEAKLKAVERHKGELPLTVRFAARLRYFTEGRILGSREFVRQQSENWFGGGRCRLDTVQEEQGAPGDVHAVRRISSARKDETSRENQ